MSEPITSDNIPTLDLVTSTQTSEIELEDRDEAEVEPDFHLFPALPFEIRQMIWKEAYPIRAVSRCVNISSKHYLSIVRSPLPPPMDRLVCRESREESMKSYQLVWLIASYWGLIPIAVRPSIDYTCCTYSELSSGFHKWGFNLDNLDMASFYHSVQKLIILNDCDLELQDYDLERAWDILQHFNNLKMLGFQDCDYSYRGHQNKKVDAGFDVRCRSLYQKASKENTDFSTPVFEVIHRSAILLWR